MSTTRLYTEEQVRSMLDKMEVIYSLEDLTPIELPSDEEIEERAERNVNKYSFIDGVEWLKDKIQGGNQ